MRVFHSLAVVCTLLFSANAAAFERDVHFGLTQWLALQAGFTPQQAVAIATGDQRIDSGDIQFLELVSIYACVGKDAEGASEIARHHYPSETRVPAPPEQRTVVAGSAAARQLAIEANKATPQQAGFLLYKLGEALHALQDSWSHQGVPDVPRALEAVACDPTLAWGHPRSRGGWSSHKADLTHEWPADTLAMAGATYDVLLQHPAIAGAARSPKAWPGLRPALDGFIRASTKSQKKKWFNDNGIADVSFLEGITLADGADAFELRWTAHKLPPLSTLQSAQHRIDAPLLDFFSRLFTQWMSGDDFDAMAAEFGTVVAPSPKAAAATTLSPMNKAELAARLRAWRIRDHGRVADIAHALQPLTAQQRNTLSSIAKTRDALARYALPIEAFFPLQRKGPEPEPLLGFIIDAVAPSAEGNERAVASTKFRHAPYDTLMVLAERVDGRWRVVSLGAMVDH